MNDIWDEESNVLFFGSIRDLEKLTALVSHCLSVLRDSTDIRQIVLETWLVVDYSIRRFLLAGFELERFCDEDFDLLYNLLPRGFSTLLNLLSDTVKYSRKVPLEPEPIEVDRFGGFKASCEFWKFVCGRYPELVERINDIQREYIAEHNPYLTEGETVAFFPGICIDQERKVEKIQLGWREVACALDDDWFKCANQLNKARNVAAHSFRTDEIARPFGLSGPNALTLAKDKCFSIMSTLLGLKGKR